MLENYHTHTYRCQHARGLEEEYVLEAIAGGLEVLGFADHTPCLFSDGYRSRIRMLPEEIADYAETILALKQKYADKIDIRLGLEVEYFPDKMPALLEMIRPYGIEYMIMGQHWCGNDESEHYSGSPTHSEALLARYCDQVAEGLETGLFSYLAHPDLFHFVGDSRIYQKHMTRLCQRVKEMDIPLEINLLGIQNQRHYPSELFWKIAGEVGNKVVLGCDAHMPKEVFLPNEEAFATELVKRYDLNLLERVPIHPYI